MTSHFFKSLFDIFSNRPEAHGQHDVPEDTRGRIIMWVNEVFGGEIYNSSYGGIPGGDYRVEFWTEIHRFLIYRLGRPQLVEGASRPEAALSYVLSCSGMEFLDFVEDIFKVQCRYKVRANDNDMVEAINHLLRYDDLPYYLTPFVKEEVKEGARTTIYTKALPKIIIRDSDVLHSQAIVPVLSLLKHPDFNNANDEFLAALEDYRKNDFNDCLTKCCSAFESVMKVICTKKGWPFDPTKDTAGPLIKVILAKTSLDSYFEQTFLIIATLRNRLSSSHGAGTTPKKVSRHLAQYALNITASAILLLVKETE